jgi:mannitol-1-phosphate 5-dehydrogenase
MKHPSILIFGAGKIGRSFIGQLFGLAGYEVVFVDIDAAIVNALNQRKSYPVVIKGEKEETLIIKNVRAVSGLAKTEVIHEISQCSLMAVSVGKNALIKIIPLIGAGLLKRYQADNNSPLDIIIAENMRSAGKFIYEQLSSCLPPDYPIDERVGLVETSIGKMVPIMLQADYEHDPLQVFAEPYNTLILDKKGFKGKIPLIKGISPKGNIKAWVDRKAFIHNLGHATVAYSGAFYHPELQYIYEALDDPDIFTFAKKVMLQAAAVLLSYYPNDFTLKDLELHIDDLLSRFQNKALKDTIFRVGQDLPRKLNVNDRFVGIIKMAKKKALPYHLILEAMAFGFFFKTKNEQGEQTETDKLFLNSLHQEFEQTLASYCNFDPLNDSELIRELKEQYLKRITSSTNKIL